MLAIYTRLSKDDKIRGKGNELKDASNSIDNQKREGKAFHNEMKDTFPHCEIYDEGKGKSGTLTEKHRPELKRLMDDIEAGKITGVWMRQQKRLARIGYTVMQFAELVKKYKVKLYFGDRGLVDLEEPMEMFTLTVLAGVDALKPAEQSKLTKKALKNNAEEGKVNGILPYGYESVDRYPKVVEPEAKVINQIYDWYLDGMGHKSIATRLNDLKIPTKYQTLALEDGKENIMSHRKHRNGVIWQESTVSNILKCTWYDGRRTTQGIEYNNVPRIVSKEKWQKVQKAKKLRKDKKRNFRPKHDVLLRGLFKCSKCGRNFTPKVKATSYENYYYCTSKNRGKHYICGNKSINISRTDSFLVKHLFKNKNLLKRLEEVTNNDGVLSQLNKEYKTIENQVEKQTRRVETYAKRLGEELEDDDFIISEYQKAKKHLKTLKESLVDVNIKISNLKSNDALDNYKKQLKQYSKDWDFETLKAAIESVVEYVELDSGKEPNGRVFFIFTIHYKGFNEVSTFYTHKPYQIWHNVSRYHTTPTEEEKQDAVDAMNFAFRKEMKAQGIEAYTLDDYDKIKDESDYWSDDTVPPLVLEPQDIFDFNKPVDISGL